MADSAQGFGATSPSGKNDDQIRELLDQVQELMIEDGADPATAEALTNYARPATVTLSGNLADLNRMGQVVLQGKIDTPPGQVDEETSNTDDAFKEPPAPPNPATGLQTPMGRIDAEGNPVSGGGGNGDSRTKSEIQAELDSRGIAYSSGDTKAELLEKLNG